MAQFNRSLNDAQFNHLLTELGWTRDQFGAYVDITTRGMRLWKQHGYPQYVCIILRLLILLKRTKRTPCSLCNDSGTIVVKIDGEVTCPDCGYPDEWRG
jgi:hypothetical protein